MPLTENIVGGVLDAVIEDATISIVQEVNALQIAVDQYVASQSAMSIEGLKAAIFGGESTVIASKLSAFQRYILKTIEGAINDSWGKGTTVRQAEKPSDTLYTWRVESAKPCPDCSSRNGQVRSLAEWQAFGLPRSGFSVCNRNCKCIIDSQGTGNFNRPKSKGE